MTDNLPAIDAFPRQGISSATMPADLFFKPSRAPSRLTIDLAPRQMLAFDDGAPDIRHVPVEILARAYRDGLRSTLQRRRLGYGDPRGSEQLRSVIAGMLSAERGLTAKVSNLCLTRGSQMAIFTVAQSLVSAGDTVVTEELSYPPAREAFRRSGAAIETVSVDEHGLKVDELEKICRRTRVRAVYVTPQHQFPTTVTMTPERRMRLILLAAQFGFSIIEDDYDHEFHFAHRPMLPLAAFDGGGHVIYIGSLSKLLSPSLRLGYIAAPSRFVDRIANEIVLIDRQGDPAMESALAEFIEAGELHRHARKMMGLYAERRERFGHCLRSEFGGRTEIFLPDGGLAFWVRFEGVDIDRMLEHARARRVHCQSPRNFSSSGSAVQALRLGFGSLDLKELEIATKRLGAALQDTLG